MNMQLMLGVGVACYFITLFFLCYYKERLNIKFCNALFIIVDMILFLLWNIACAERGWLKDGFMTLENISPFTFTVIPLTVFMNKKTKEFAFSTIAFLHLGMFLATLISPEYEVIFSFKTEATFTYATEAMCHILAALFGIFLNLVLDTHCFNLNPNQYSIYMLDIFGTYEATVIAYYFGVILVLTLGMQSGHALCKLVDKIKSQHTAHKLLKEHHTEAEG